MSPPFHEHPGARFTDLHGRRVVNDYGDWRAEHAALWRSAAVLDLSFRSRLCLVGADRARFLHGQVTNDINRLRPGQGCPAAITTAKGKMEAYVNVLCLADELLLDFAPGLAEKISQRLEKYVVADDVQVVDVAPHYGLLSVQGPQAEAVLRRFDGSAAIPAEPLASVKLSGAAPGEIYLVRHARLAGDPLAPGEMCGFDLLVPTASLGLAADRLLAAAREWGGCAGGWQALETARIEAGIPRYGADMDETHIPLECGLESRAITYTKGCYIGQEVINRIHSVGHVNRELRGLRLADDLERLPERGDRLLHAGREAGHITSAVKSPRLNANIALGYVQRGANEIGTPLTLRTAGGESAVRVVSRPFDRIPGGA